jgi:hypothetical protein
MDSFLTASAPKKPAPRSIVLDDDDMLNDAERELLKELQKHEKEKREQPKPPPPKSKR